MPINRNNIITYEKEHYENDFTNLDLAVYYSRNDNNFNIIRKNIEFEDINLKNIIDARHCNYIDCESNRYSTLETVELILKYKPHINAKNINLILK
jgi:hypothetical protein